MNQIELQHRNWTGARNRLWGIMPAHEGARRDGVPVDLLSEPNWRTILKLVCLRHGVAVHEVLSPAKGQAPVSAARQQAVCIVYSHCAMSTTTVGRLFGRHHTTVVNALQNAQGTNKKQRWGTKIGQREQRTQGLGVDTRHGNTSASVMG